MPRRLACCLVFLLLGCERAEIPAPAGPLERQDAITVEAQPSYQQLERMTYCQHDVAGNDGVDARTRFEYDAQGRQVRQITVHEASGEPMAEELRTYGDGGVTIERWLAP